MAKKEIDKRIKKHLTKKGEEKYQFSLYLGVDPLTGKKRKTTRRGFSTLLAAERALKRLEADIYRKKDCKLLRLKRARNSNMFTAYGLRIIKRQLKKALGPPPNKFLTHIY